MKPKLLTFTPAFTALVALAITVPAALGNTGNADTTESLPIEDYQTREIIYDKPEPTKPVDIYALQNVEGVSNKAYEPHLDVQSSKLSPETQTASYTANESVTQKQESTPATAPARTGGNFEYDGVWRDGRWTYKWYSSNALKHYRTSEWTPDAQGVYRDADGYAVVASSELAQGTVVEDTPFGKAKVYDSGCPTGVLDVYVNY